MSFFQISMWQIFISKILSKLEPIFFKILYTVRYLIPFISSLNNVNLWLRGLGLLASMLVTKGSISVVQRSRFWKPPLRIVRCYLVRISNKQCSVNTSSNLRRVRCNNNKMSKMEYCSERGKFRLIPFLWRANSELGFQAARQLDITVGMLSI